MMKTKEDVAQLWKSGKFKISRPEFRKIKMMVPLLDIHIDTRHMKHLESSLYHCQCPAKHQFSRRINVSNDKILTSREACDRDSAPKIEP